MILSVTQYQSGQVTLAECLLIIVLAADFFLPMRLLGSYFLHRHEWYGGQ